MKVYQVEISNICNLECSYCPHPNQARAKGMMSFSTFRDVVSLVKKCEQNIMHLHNFGEPLLHPQISAFISYARSQEVACSFYTNGLRLTSSLAEELYKSGLQQIFISEHIKGQAKSIKKMLEENNIPISIVEIYNPHLQPKHTWAGQINYQNYTSEIGCKVVNEPCIFSRKNAVVILWDGSINICCIDVNGRGIRGRVQDYLKEGSSYEFQSIDLCSNCTLMRVEEDFL